MKSAAQIFQRVNTQNLKVVVLSIVAATTFWFFNALNKEYAATIRYPVVFDYDREQFVATEELPDKVQINVSGIGWTIFRSGYLYNAEPIYIPIENPEKDGKVLGSSLFGVLSEGLANLELNYVLDDTIHLQVERILRKPVRLIVDSASLQLEKDYFVVSNLNQSIDSLVLSGPTSHVDAIGDTLLVTINERAIDENFSGTVGILTGDNLVKADTNVVFVSFNVDRYVPVEHPVLLTKKNFPESTGVSLADSTIIVKYFKRASEADSLKQDDFRIVVDYNRMVPFDSTIQPLILKYPKDIKRLSITSQRAKVIRTP